MSAEFWDTDALLNQVRQAQLEAAQKAFDEAKAVASSELSQTIEEDLRMIYAMSVASWYRAFTPSMYGRTHQLYYLLEVENNSGEGLIDVGWEISDEGLSYKSWGKKSTFKDPWTQIFLVGFHGGWISTKEGLRWPVQSEPIPEMFERSKEELESSYSNRLLDILQRETMARYNKYYG